MVGYLSWDVICSKRRGVNRKLYASFGRGTDRVQGKISVHILALTNNPITTGIDLFLVSVLSSIFF